MAADTYHAGDTITAEIEAHSIDIIPENERTGRVRGQFNLIDFYLVKKGRYDVKSFFTPAGIYGGWRWTAIIPYLLALAAQVPFLDQTLYVGPMVSVLGGADISWLVGFVVAGAAYLVASRLTGGTARLPQPGIDGMGELEAHPSS